jgi:hypothetical protein
MGIIELQILKTKSWAKQTTVIKLEEVASLRKILRRHNHIYEIELAKTDVVTMTVEGDSLMPFNENESLH